MLPSISPSRTRHFITCSSDGYVKVSDTNKIEQSLEIYKPRKPANCLEVKGNFTVCGFRDEVYFYDSLVNNENEMKTFTYLGSLQFENENVLRIRNVPFSDNYYVLTEQKVYMIYVKRKKSSHNATSLSKSSLSMMNSQVSGMSSNPIKGTSTTLPKVQIEI